MNSAVEAKEGYQVVNVACYLYTDRNFEVLSFQSVNILFSISRGTRGSTRPQ
jgi:hypothetical protein